MPAAMQTDEDGVVLPVLKYGFRSTPAPWHELKQIVGEGDLAKLSRSRAQQIQYEKYKRDILRSWKSILDFVLCNKLHFESELDPESERLVANIPSEKKTRKVILLNDFPYCMADDIEHWILWKFGGECSERDRLEAEQELQETLKDVVDFIHWVNPPALQSLPEIDHVHILVLRGTK